MNDNVNDKNTYILNLATGCENEPIAICKATKEQYRAMRWLLETLDIPYYFEEFNEGIEDLAND
jgi:hypothetical protein